MLFRIILLVVFNSLASAPLQTLSAQRVITDDEWCDDEQRDSGSERFCEIREFDLDARDLVRVDGGDNGGVRVEGWHRSEIRLRAKVVSWSRGEDPLEIAQKIQIRTSSAISADGPRWQEGQGWSVSFHLMVPTGSNLDLESHNGGIQVTEVRGEMDLSADNGGIHLRDVGGDVRGRAKNGGVNVHLTGGQWEGEKLDVHANNGGINLSLPEDYRADLSVHAANGTLDTDFPVTVRGRLRHDRISTELNGGGPLLRLSANNGGVRIRRSR